MIPGVKDGPLQLLIVLMTEAGRWSTLKVQAQSQSESGHPAANWSDQMGCIVQLWHQNTCPWESRVTP